MFEFGDCNFRFRVFEFGDYVFKVNERWDLVVLGWYWVRVSGCWGLEFRV